MSMFRNLMSAKVRSNAGCWTCRLRRKKCDEERPICAGCQALEITCYFDEEKPSWMDGGPKQKEMADRIKAQVKKQASQRRDRKYMELLEAGTNSMRPEPKNSLREHASHSNLDERMSSNPFNFGRGASESPPRSHSSGHDHSLTPPSSHTSGASPPEIPWTSKIFDRQFAQEDGGPDIDVHFIMIYLDYVFPYLFPWYRPPVLSGGRGWVLDILQSNKSVYYTAISLASYFFGVVLANGDVSHVECTDRMAHKLQSQLEKGLKELQKEVLACRQNADVFERLLVMQSIIQMVVFEVATANEDHWKMHLDAAIALFFQILPDPTKWTEVLHGFYTPRWPPPSMGIRRPWSTNQAALRFFTANLLHMDVMASITLERHPRLRTYQENIIPGCFSKACRENAQTAGPLFMDEFIGLHNWIVQMIGDVSSLDAWKKEQLSAGTFSVNDLLSRGKVLSDAMQASLQNLDKDMAGITGEAAFSMIVADPLEELRGTSTNNGDSSTNPVIASHNAVWLRATLVYLYTVVFGWQPNHPEIRSHVIHITKCLTSLPRGACLRNLVWPYCLAGCLAPPEDEDKFRLMSRRLGALQVFGTVKEATEIMEKVWACREQIDESWDVSKCLRILGHRSLLI
ncbi:unnamed protein product [Clonostachys rhizophaga]|uniref:Zn(2)-C6 fungal-type domain-containing protein n=1 Tax=Clonostachys rhizophaga TaxID=160324 RepID=A0A9N9VTH4_9HYPO|nr:unnamed protein product [Clonostachys rhizophaga]